MKQIIRYDISKLGDLCCDNPKCDYESKDTAFSQDMVGRPCPKCGENLLTQDGYDRTMRVLKIVDGINAFFAFFGLGSEDDKDFGKTKVSFQAKPCGEMEIKIKD